MCSRAVSLQYWIFVLAAVAGFLAGCGHSGLRAYADRVISAAATIDDMKKPRTTNPEVWEKPSYYLSSNGNAVYVEPQYGVAWGSRFYAECDYHWEVDSRNRIVGYLTVGPKCTRHRGRDDLDPRLIEGATKSLPAD